MPIILASTGVRGWEEAQLSCWGSGGTAVEALLERTHDGHEVQDTTSRPLLP